MKIGLALNINVSKIEKERLFEGKNGKYLNATIFVDTEELDQYGNSGMITQDVTKAEKDQGVKGPILGNGKAFWKSEGGKPQQSAPEPQPEVELDSIPF